MARLPARGSSSATPYRDQAELGACLTDLGVSDAFDEESIERIHAELGEVVGQWIQEKARLESKAVAKVLVSIGNRLNEIGGILTAHQTGIRRSVDVEIVSQLAERMALDPTLGSIAAAKESMASFGQEASRIARNCLAVGAHLRSRSAKPGRSRLDWYDEFTALLLCIALKAGVKPSWQKDRVTSEWSGWLFDAARVLEAFLPEKMRSRTPEACGKRLERSQKRLGQRPRQNTVTAR